MERTEDRGEFDDVYGTVTSELHYLFHKYLRSIRHPKTSAISNLDVQLLTMPWQTKNNSVDCGVFTMRQMETFVGKWKGYHCGLTGESIAQNTQIRALRFLYAAELVLSQINIIRDRIIEQADEFDLKSKEEKNKIVRQAYMNKAE